MKFLFLRIVSSRVYNYPEMPTKKLKSLNTFSSDFDKKIVNLTMLFFALSAALFIAGIFKLNRLTKTLPFSNARDYVIFEKSTTLGSTCDSAAPCTDLLRVYRSGKVMGLGSKMFINILNAKQLDNLLAAIDKSDILNKDCPDDQEGTNTQTYTIKLGVQVKRASANACKTELNQIESQIYQ